MSKNIENKAPNIDTIIESHIWDFVLAAEKQIQPMFSDIREICQHNQIKVLRAFQQEQIGLRHFTPTTGYGYDDIGRDALDRTFALALGCEDALVRPQFASGTHAIATAMFGLTKPGDHILSVTGKPYDTLEEAIGIRGNQFGSLISQGREYNHVELTAEKAIDIDTVLQKIKSNTALVFIQRSRGYSWRNALSVSAIDNVISLIKQQNSDICVLVDNCYGEFAEMFEPTRADVLAGSLIKNPGGGLAPTGGYIAGRHILVDRIANRLTSPGIGREVGSYAASYSPFFQGLFMAPHIVGEALKGSILIAVIFEKLGFNTMPNSKDSRSDIIQAVELNNAARLLSFCRAVQKASPIDSHVVPEPWDMPGYNEQVIMAAGTFVQGASIELSADAPLKPPYIVYFQGGLTYEHTKYSTVCILTEMLNNNQIAIP